MSEGTNNNSGLYFVVGGLVAVVLGAGLFFGGYIGGHKSQTTTIERSVGPFSSSTTTTTTKTAP
jgi:hypothetical protein